MLQLTEVQMKRQLDEMTREVTNYISYKLITTLNYTYFYLQYNDLTQKLNDLPKFT